MATNELLIKINADAKNAQAAFEKMRDEVSDLEGVLKSVGAVTGVAFAAITATIGLSIKSFQEANAGVVSLNLALQNQGLYTKELSEQYQELANEIQKKTGADGDSIVAAIAQTQALIGQREITGELTEAVVDFAAAQKIDLQSAFNIVARAANGQTRGLKVLGIQIDENLSKDEKLAQIQEQLAQRYSGAASAANLASGGIKGLSAASGDLLEKLGERFAPIFLQINLALTKFFETIAQNEVLFDLGAALLTAGAAITGIITLLAGGAIAFNAIAAAAATFGVALNASLLGIPLVIAGVVAAITLLALNWDKTMQFLQSATAATFAFLTSAFLGLGNLIRGLFTLDADQIKKGLSEIKGALADGVQAYKLTNKAIEDEQKLSGDKQDAERKARADREAREVAELENRKLAAIKAGRDARLAELRGESPIIIDLKRKEAELLKSITEEKDQEIVRLTRERILEVQSLEEQAIAEDLARQEEYNNLRLQSEREFRELGLAQNAEFTAQEQQAFQNKLLTERDADKQIKTEIINNNIEAQNQQLINRKKYGESYALINKAIQSDEVQGAKSASGELVALQQSKNETLKSIGKAAAVTQIAISTAESAMNVYKGFSTIPIIGQALGVAGAAAAIAFGAERTSQVLAAQEGGFVPGGAPFTDRIPALLTPGEFVVPRESADQVISAAAGGGSEIDQRILDTLASIDQKFSAPQVTNITTGDVLAESSFIDRIVQGISDAIEFRNAKIVGVNT